VVFAYLASDSITDLSSRQREDYYRGLASRYLTMTLSERNGFEADWKVYRKSAEMRHQIETQIALNLIRGVTDQYAQTPIDQQEAFLDNILFMLGATDSLLSREMELWAHGNPVQQALRDPEKMARGIRDYNRDFLGGTNAGERADICRLTGDLLERARQKR